LLPNNVTKTVTNKHTGSPILTRDKKEASNKPKNPLTRNNTFNSIGNYNKTAKSHCQTRRQFKLSKNQNPGDSTKDLIIKTINEQRPQTTRQLVDLIQKTTTLTKKEIITALNELETEEKIHLNAEQEKNTNIGTYVFSSEASWYWIIVALTLVTTITVFTIPQDSYPLVYVRNVLGVILVLFLPGYAFIKVVFQKKVPIKTSSASFDNIERFVLSIAMSLALTSMVGLILYYTPIGIGLTPITISLQTIITVLATVAMALEYRAKSNIQQTEIV
jgi:hypothetical protein